MRVLAPGEALAAPRTGSGAVAERRERGLARRSVERAGGGRAARAAGLAGEPSRAIEWADRAIRLCDADEDGPEACRRARSWSVSSWRRDATDRAVRPAEEAVRLAEAADVDASSLALAHVVLARALLSARRTDEARPQAERALAEARAAGAPGLEVDALTRAAFLDEIDGDREAAADGLGKALRLARAEGELAAELRAHYSLAPCTTTTATSAVSLPVLRAAMTRVTETGLRWSDPGSS